MPTFGDRLRQAREARQWGIPDLAEHAKVPYMTIYRLETHVYGDTLTSTGMKLAWALGVSLDWLAGVYDALPAPSAPRSHERSPDA